MTEGELLADVLASVLAEADPANAFTARELRKLTGWGHAKLRDRLHALNDERRLDVVTVTRPTLGGVMRPTQAYRLKPSESP